MDLSRSDFSKLNLGKVPQQSHPNSLKVCVTVTQAHPPFFSGLLRRFASAQRMPKEKKVKKKRAPTFVGKLRSELRATIKKHKKALREAQRDLKSITRKRA